MRRVIFFLLLSCGFAACGGGVDLSGDGTGDGEPDATGDSGDGTDVPPDVPPDVADVPADESGPDGTDGGGDCAPMDAAPEGACEMMLGFKWDGARCVSIGSGCSCVGLDCDAVYDTIAECVSARLACYGDVCRAQQAAGRVCDGGGCATSFGPFWDGSECFATVGCECAGADCGAAFASEEECVAVHASCDGALCLATDGQWFPAAAGFCGFTCGVPSDIDCFTPADSCNCGPGRNFVAGTGCVVEAVECDQALLCRQTSGRWVLSAESPCGFDCGVANPAYCESPFDSCDCGANRNFDSSRGCVPDWTCVATERQQVCTSTGGTWHECGTGDPGCSCGDYNCGVPNYMDPCIMPGCDCGPSRNFDSALGCLWDGTCYGLEAGANCRGGGSSSSCRSGLLCCSSSGAMDLQTCEAPCCPDDPSCADDGCPLPTP
jgi:hypothetical protein